MQHENSKPVQDFIETKQSQEIWYICTGMCSQWNGMGKSLLGIPLFSQAIDKCAASLLKYDFNLKDILVNPDSTTFESITNAMVGITAIQVGLIDILTYLGIKPTGIFGHSMGEIACSYADGCLTLEQAMEVAYLQGNCVSKEKLPKGAMASVGLTWQDCLELCRGKEMEPACHNSEKSVTIAGPEKEVFELVDKLKTEEIFARVVETNGIAFHSKDMMLVYPKYLEELRKVITKPNRRSEKWISTSSNDIAEGDPNYENDVQLCSAEYHANNLRYIVRFHDALKTIPDGSIVIEVAPHAALQPILKHALPSNCERVVLTDCEEQNGIETLSKGIDHLRRLGIDCDIKSILP